MNVKIYKEAVPSFDAAVIQVLSHEYGSRSLTLAIRN